jgi:hypothetical protein
MLSAIDNYGSVAAFAAESSPHVPELHWRMIGPFHAQ